MAESNIWKNQIGSWCRLCPICSDTIEHTGIHSKRNAFRPFKKSVPCRKCSMTGKISSEETRKKISDAQKGHVVPIQRRIDISNTLRGRTLDIEHKNNIAQGITKAYANGKIREKLSEAVKSSWRNTVIRKKMLSANRWNNISCDKGQLELIEKWNKLGFHFEPNFQIKTDVDLFYVDGYDKEKNVVLEYDSKYHRIRTQKKKDEIRQNIIIETLKPKKFWRYDVVNKVWKNVIGEKI